MRLSLYILLSFLSLSACLQAEAVSSNVANNAKGKDAAEIISPTPASTATRLAVVKVAVLLDESPRAKALAKTLKNQYLQQEQILKKEHDALKQLEASLDRNSEKLSSSERIKKSRDFRQRKRKYTRDYEMFRDQLNTERQDALVMVRQEVLDAITTVRERQKIDIVIENYISASDAVDITPDVIQYLNENYQKELAMPSATSSTDSSNTATQGH